METKTQPQHQAVTMARAMKVCPVRNCPELVVSGRCDAHKREAEQRRGTAAARGYGHAHRTGFREAVLKRDPACVCFDEHHGHGSPCGQKSTVADHWPRSRRELVRLKLDADDQRYGRGICTPCHGKHTTKAQPGGFLLR